MATGKNAICKKFYSKIPQVGTCGVNFLCQELCPKVSYFCCPPVKLIGKVVGHLLSKPGVNCLLILPVWVSTAFWVALHQNENFQKAIVKELRFKPKFFMSNGAQSLFSRNPHFEIVAYVLKSK